MNWRNRIAFTIIGIFSLFGAFFIGVVLHEYYHYYDFKEFSPSKDELCVVALPTAQTNMSKAYAGYYQFQVGPNQTSPSDERMARSENTAYIITFIVGLIWLFAYLNVQTGRIEQSFKDKYGDIFSSLKRVKKDVPDELPSLDTIQNNINNIYKDENSSKSEYST